VSVETPANQITGANSRPEFRFDGCESHNAMVAGASALPAAVAQFARWAAAHHERLLWQTSN